MLRSQAKALASLAVLLVACERPSYDPVADVASERSVSSFRSACFSYNMPSDPFTRKDFKGEQFSKEYNIGLSDYKVSAYLPSKNGEVVSGRFPLAIILHGRTYDYNVYKKLQERLAANGIASAALQYSISHGESDYYEEYFIEKLENFLEEVYGGVQNDQCPLYNKVTKDIVLIGHSMGGGLAVYAADVLAKDNPYGLSVKSVTALAPNPQSDKEWTVNPKNAQGLLVLFGSDDSDTGVNSCGNSGFSLYDMSGYNTNEYSLGGYWKNRFVKSMVYLKDVSHIDFTDNGVPSFQETANAYVVSFLRWSLLNDQAYRVYFKYQAPLDYKMKVNIQYSESTSKKVIDHFEGKTMANTSGGINSYQNITQKKGDSRTIDFNSPHFTNVLQLQWDKKDSKVPKAVFPIGVGQTLKTASEQGTIGTSTGGNLKNYKFFSFRVGQIYKPNINKDHLDFSIRITYKKSGAVKSQAVKVAEFTDIPFPFAHNQDSKTKSDMKTVLVPLCAFGDINFQNDIIQSVSFEFDVPGFEKGHIQTDNLEFIY